MESIHKEFEEGTEEIMLTTPTIVTMTKEELIDMGYSTDETTDKIQENFCKEKKKRKGNKLEKKE